MASDLVAAKDSGNQQTMKVLVINCGSSSIKYQLYDMADESILAKGLVERIGEEESRYEQTTARASARSTRWWPTTMTP